MIDPFLYYLSSYDHIRESWHTMEIRKIEPRDHEQVMTIENAVWNEKNSPVVGYFATVAEYEASLENRQVIVACQAEKVLGFLDLFQMHSVPSAKFTISLGLGIAPFAQRQGVATALLQWTIEYAQKAGYHKLALRVLGTNPAAQALYKKNGFVVEGIFKDEFYLDGHFVDDISMAYFL